MTTTKRKFTRDEVRQHRRDLAEQAKTLCYALRQHHHWLWQALLLHDEGNLWGDGHEAATISIRARNAQDALLALVRELVPDADELEVDDAC